MTQTYKVQVSMNQAHLVDSGFTWKQGDFGFQIEIEVLDFDTTGVTPQIIFRKSSGAVESTSLTQSGNKFTYTVRGTELDTPGPCICDLKLKNSTTQRISTASFKYFTIPDTMDGFDNQAESYSDTIETLCNSLNENVDELRNQFSESVVTMRSVNNDLDVLKTPSFIDFTSAYSGTANYGKIFASNRTIPAKSYIRNIKCICGRTEKAAFYLIDKLTNEIVYKKIFQATSGETITVDIDYSPLADVIYAFSGPIKYYYDNTNKYAKALADDGLHQSDGGIYLNIGDEINASVVASGLYIFAIEVAYTIKDIKTDLTIDVITNENKFPNLLSVDSYTSTVLYTSYYVSTKKIPQNSILKSVKVYVVSDFFDLMLIDDDDKIYFYNRFAVSANAWNTIDINIFCDKPLRACIRGGIRYKNDNDYTEEDLWSDGLYEIQSYSNWAVGTQMTIVNTSTTFRPVMACQLEISNYADSFDELISNAVSQIDYRNDYNITKRTWLPKGLQTKQKLLRYKDAPGEYFLLGRWYKQSVDGIECNVTNNCGSEIHLKVSGATTLYIGWKAMTETHAYYCYSIDGGALTRSNITSKNITLPDTGTHYVRIITDGITENIGKWANGTGFAFSNISANAGQISAVKPENPIIMFFGDSITEGIRALGVTSGDMGDTNSATGAFPWFCSEKLGAVSYRIGYGASGIIQDGSFRRAIFAAQYFYENHPADNFRPDAIVINYGTNDYQAEAETFISEYNKFIKMLSVRYPGVDIFVMIPFGQACAESIRTVAENNPSVFLIETSGYTGIEYADGIHPTSAGAATAANYLVNDLLELIY